MIDLELIITTTYGIEGDGLEILLAFDRVERLRALGSDLDNEGVRARCKPLYMAPSNRESVGMGWGEAGVALIRRVHRFRVSSRRRATRT